ncbi:MAG: GNAT family N-acetyltransferase [Ideonella sp.]|nr:GNAT family N-acetyltransferase [Ideonella sp.]MCC7455870.1 GNAT family N-acetyltransferase [Nitrospira sp.]
MTAQPHQAAPAGALLGPRIVRRLVSLAARLGIEAELFFVTAEGVMPAGEPIRIDSRYSAGWAGPDDIPELVRVEPGTPAALCAERLRSGLRCFAIKDGARIVAKMWCEMDECRDPGWRRRLDDDEAYLFNAYTDPSLRGQNLAPSMRQQCYAALRAIGRTRVFSCTDYTNTAARRFKRKLGAIDEVLCLRLSRAGGAGRTWVLRRWPRRPAQDAS